MRLGVNAWAFPADWDLAETLAHVREAGFEGVEWTVAEEGRLTLASTEEEAASLRQQVERAGLEVPSLASGLLWRYPLTDPDPSVRERGREVVRAMLRLAPALGAGAVLVVPGVVTERVSYEVAYEQALAEIRRLGEEAAAAQVILGIENVWNRFLLSPLEMREFLDAVDNPWVGAYLDVANMVVHGYPEQWIRILGGHVKRVHVKDFRREVGTLAGFTDLLEGDVDFGAVMAALEEIGYDGYLVAEFSPHPRYPLERLRRWGQAMRTIRELGHGQA